MAVTIQIRRGTAAEWTSANPILAAGELGLETDTGKIKVGDGVASWNTTIYNVSSGSTVADISIGTPAEASGSGGIAFDSDTATLTYTPPEIPNLETTTSLSINANVLTYTDEDGVDTDIDLSLYLDDTNLSRITNGVYDRFSGLATFTRDDDTTFTVDFNDLFSNSFNLNVAADDSTLRVINAGETISILGSGTVTTTSNEEGAIVIAGSSTFDLTGNVTGNVIGNLTGDVTGDVTGNVTGDLTGDVTGNVTGNLTGDVTGNVTGDLTGDVTGDVTGNVTGDLTGDVTGNLTGNVTGDVTGNLTGNLTGDVTGDVTGNLTGDVTGNLTGDVTGNVTGDVTGNLIGNITGNLTGDVNGSVFGDDSTLIVDAVNNTLQTFALTREAAVDGETLLWSDTNNRWQPGNLNVYLVDGGRADSIYTNEELVLDAGDST
jgi:hypothetical protein